MVPDKVKVELKRFLSDKQVEELSKQLDTYEKRVRQAVKQFDVKGREAKAKGQEQLDKFATQVKRTGAQLEKQLKTFVEQEGKVLNKGLNELFTYFRSLSKSQGTKATKSAKSTKKAAGKTTKTSARKVRTATRSAVEAQSAH